MKLIVVVVEHETWAFFKLTLLSASVLCLWNRVELSYEEKIMMRDAFDYACMIVKGVCNIERKGSL